MKMLRCGPVAVLETMVFVGNVANPFVGVEESCISEVRVPTGCMLADGSVAKAGMEMAGSS